MPISALAGLFFGVAVFAVGVYHATLVAPRLRRFDSVLRDGGGEGKEKDEHPAIAFVRAQQAEYGKRVEERLSALESAVAQDLLRIGFLRYNSFSDVGSDQSFTLALLNRSGDGVVVTSIFGREETRTYGKAVRRFVPQQGVSKEEQAAIAMARNRDGAAETP